MKMLLNIMLNQFGFKGRTAMTKRTFQPSKRRRAKTHGYRARTKRTLQRRIRKGRKRLIP